MDLESLQLGWRLKSDKLTNSLNKPTALTKVMDLESLQLGWRLKSDKLTNSL